MSGLRSDEDGVGLVDDAAPLGDASADPEAGAPPPAEQHGDAHGGEEDEHSKKGRDWKGDVCQCCGACFALALRSPRSPGRPQATAWASARTSTSASKRWHARASRPFGSPAACWRLTPPPSLPPLPALPLRLLRPQHAARAAAQRVRKLRVVPGWVRPVLAGWRGAARPVRRLLPAAALAQGDAQAARAVTAAGAAAARRAGAVAGLRRARQHRHRLPLPGHPRLHGARSLPPARPRAQQKTQIERGGANPHCASPFVLLLASHADLRSLSPPPPPPPPAHRLPGGRCG